MLTLRSVFLNALWVLGLSGLLATFSFMDWYRQQQGWRWKKTFTVARFLAPMSLSLMFTCIGIGGAGWVGYAPSPWWQTTLWLVLAVSFLIQFISYLRFARKNGWDTSV